MSRVQNDVGMLQNFLLDAAENVILSTLTILGVVLIMLSKSWTLALAVLLPVPFVIIGTNRYWRGLMKLWRRVWHQNSSLGARLADTLNGVRVVRALPRKSAKSKISKQKRPIARRHNECRAESGHLLSDAGLHHGIGPAHHVDYWRTAGTQRTPATGCAARFLTVLLQPLYEPVQKA
jgi:ABC-type multidrug transport system fused ATPase/permease subunit